MDSKPAITPEQIAKLQDVRDKVQALVNTVRVDKGGAACVFVMLSVTPSGKPELTIDSNCTKEEAAVATHLARLFLPMLNGMPQTPEEAGAMTAGRDPFTGGKLPKDSLIITD